MPEGLAEDSVGNIRAMPTIDTGYIHSAGPMTFAKGKQCIRA